MKVGTPNNQSPLTVTPITYTNETNNTQNFTNITKDSIKYMSMNFYYSKLPTPGAKRSNCASKMLTTADKPMPTNDIISIDEFETEIMKKYYSKFSHPYLLLC